MKSTSIKMFALNVGVWNCSPGMLLGKLVHKLVHTIPGSEISNSSVPVVTFDSGTCTIASSSFVLYKSRVCLQ